MIKTPRIISVFLLVTLILSACNLPTNNQGSVAETAAAQTVAAQLTAIAPITATIPVIVTSTNTPGLVPPTAIIPSATSPAIATAICDGAQFVTDVTVPDDTVFTPNQAFTKTWRLKNTGTCSWTPSYSVAFLNGNSMNGPATQALTGNVNPGQTVDISVNFTAPAAPGNYTGNYRLRNAAGLLFSSFYVQIKVHAATPPTATNTAIVFAVTNVAFNITGSCPFPYFNLSVTITTNSAGTVNLHRVWNDGGSDSTPKTLVFSGAGSQSIDYGPVSVPSPGSSWTDIYIDSPNHQQFGRASFTCP